MTFSMDAAYNLLAPHFQERIRRHEPLANHSPLDIGGQADLWITLTSSQEVVQLVQKNISHCCWLAIAAISCSLIKGWRGLWLTWQPSPTQ